MQEHSDSSRSSSGASSPVPELNAGVMTRSMAARAARLANLEKEQNEADKFHREQSSRAAELQMRLLQLELRRLEETERLSQELEKQEITEKILAEKYAFYASFIAGAAISTASKTGLTIGILAEAASAGMIGYLFSSPENNQMSTKILAGIGGGHALPALISLVGGKDLFNGLEDLLPEDTLATEIVENLKELGVEELLGGPLGAAIVTSTMLMASAAFVGAVIEKITRKRGQAAENNDFIEANPEDELEGVQNNQHDEEESLPPSPTEEQSIIRTEADEQAQSNIEETQIHPDDMHVLVENKYAMLATTGILALTGGYYGSSPDRTSASVFFVSAVVFVSTLGFILNKLYNKHQHNRRPESLEDQIPVDQEQQQEVIENQVIERRTRRRQNAAGEIPQSRSR